MELSPFYAQCKIHHHGPSELLPWYPNGTARIHAPILVKIIPKKIIDKYDLERKVEDGWVYARVLKGMYGLPQAGLVANSLFSKQLKAAGYYQC